MRKLLCRCVLLLVLCLTPFYLCGAAYMKTTAYQNLRRDEWTDVYLEMPESIDIAVFGPSHGRAAFLYYPEDVTFFNFSLGSQTPQYDRNLMREYQKRFSPNAVVVLTVTYLSPFWSDPEAIFLAKQARYYHILSPGNIEHVDYAQWGLERFFPVLKIRPC